MEFDKKQLLHLADLAKLHIKEENVDSYNHQLQDILAYVDKINKLDLQDVEESLSGIDKASTGPRPDEVEDSQVGIIEDAYKAGDYVKAPNVFNNK